MFLTSKWKCFCLFPFVFAFSVFISSGYYRFFVIYSSNSQEVEWESLLSLIFFSFSCSFIFSLASIFLISSIFPLWHLLFPILQHAHFSISFTFLFLFSLTIDSCSFPIQIPLYYSLVSLLLLITAFNSHLTFCLYLVSSSLTPTLSFRFFCHGFSCPSLFFCIPVFPSLFICVLFSFDAAGS